jgi:hypothetical protein
LPQGEENVLLAETDPRAVSKRHDGIKAIVLETLVT